MKRSARSRWGRNVRRGCTLARRVGSRVKDHIPRRVDAADSPGDGHDSDNGGGDFETDHAGDQPLERTPDAAPSAPPSAKRRLEDLRQATGEAAVELEELNSQRDQLRSERRDTQRVLGEQHGRRVMPRLRVEKTNGVPSFVVAQRMTQRVHRRALDPMAGLDGVGAVFAKVNAEGITAFAHSHGVPTTQAEIAAVSPQAQKIVVHAFKGEVGLVEVHGPVGVRHFDAEGNDPGDIRPAATYDVDVAQPVAFADLCRWSNALSAHIPRPYVQLHYSFEKGTTVLDRIDVDPDRIPVLTPAWDERLGSLFDGAYSRFLVQPYLRGGLDNRVPGGTFNYEEAR